MIITTCTIWCIVLCISQCPSLYVVHCILVQTYTYNMLHEDRRRDDKNPIWRGTCSKSRGHIQTKSSTRLYAHGADEAGFMLAHRRRRWPNNKAVSGGRLVWCHRTKTSSVYRGGVPLPPGVTKTLSSEYPHPCPSPSWGSLVRRSSPPSPHGAPTHQKAFIHPVHSMVSVQCPAKV